MYNSENTIKNTLESVLNQCYGNFEIIIVNDGSNDSSKKIVEGYMSNDANKTIRLINQENAGVSAARNRGIEEAKGDYIAFLDSDDLWANNKLTRQIEVMEKHSDIFLLSTLSMKNSKDHVKSIQNISFNKLLFKNYFVTSSVILRRKALDDVGLFNINKSHSEDYELWLAIAGKYRTAILNEKLTIYTEETIGLSNNLIKMQKGEIGNYNKLYKNKEINFSLYILAITFSNIKLLRRVIMKYSKVIFKK